MTSTNGKNPTFAANSYINCFIQMMLADTDILYRHTGIAMENFTIFNILSGTKNHFHIYNIVKKIKN